jgi:hypothetical protein
MKNERTQDEIRAPGEPDVVAPNALHANAELGFP